MIPKRKTTISQETYERFRRVASEVETFYNHPDNKQVTGRNFEYVVSVQKFLEQNAGNVPALFWFLPKPKNRNR